MRRWAVLLLLAGCGHSPPCDTPACPAPTSLVKWCTLAAGRCVIGEREPVVCPPRCTESGCVDPAPYCNLDDLHSGDRITIHLAGLESSLAQRHGLRMSISSPTGVPAVDKAVVTIDGVAARYDRPRGAFVWTGTPTTMVVELPTYAGTMSFEGDLVDPECGPRCGM